MSRPLKVWGCSLGRDRCLVAATSKTEAARLLGMSLFVFNQFVSETGNKADIAEAMARPGVGLRRPIDAQDAPYEEITATHMPRRTTRRKENPVFVPPQTVGLSASAAIEAAERAEAAYAGKIGRIAEALRRLADDVERRAKPARHPSIHTPMSSACVEVTSTILSTLPNLGLASLADYAAESDSFRSFAAGATNEHA